MCVKIVDGDYVKLDIYGPLKNVILPDLTWPDKSMCHYIIRHEFGKRVNGLYFNNNVYEKCIETSWNADSNLS